MNMASLRLTVALAVALCLPTFAFAQQKVKLEGVITDETGAPIIGAEVTLSAGSFTAKQTTDVEGRFVFDAITLASGTLSVRAAGFATVSRKWSAEGKESLQLDLTLEPARISEQVTVTATRTETRVSDTAASVLVLSSEDLSATAALTLDDALRQVAGFSLFRRSGSRTANPTSQGVSLRAVGASGASRAVVLDDGIPINDPFGGWVYWGRIPRESVGRIEVVRGGASNLYGTDALGGVINILPRETRDLTSSIELSYGNQQTPDLSFYMGGRVGQLGGSISAEAFHTDGYHIIEERDRGRVDTRAGAEHTTLDITLERLFSDRGRFFLNGLVFGESRENGTVLQQNRTHIRQGAIGADLQSRQAGAFVLRAYASTQVFDQDFTAVSADRNSEALTRSQRVPAQQIGFLTQWSRQSGSRQTLLAGLEGREVRGASDELAFVAGNLTSAIGAGGRERILGLFGQDTIRITDRWLVTASARLDRWRNFDALTTTKPLTSPAPSTVTEFRDRTETAFSPRLSVLHKLTENVSLLASGYRAFRAPTLNELYRAFRVGNVLTQANADLKAERLTGGEAGASVAGLGRRLNVRGTFFWSELTRPIANVTLSVTPALIIRQRQNLGRTRSRGLELEAEARVSDDIELSGGYLFADATVLEFPANTGLEGLLIPQVPRHQLTLQARYSNPRRLTAGLQARFVGKQFDDDRNDFELERYFTLDALVARRLTSGLEVFAAFENIFDERYSIGRTPVRTIGPPITARFGLRFRLGAR
jgi:outer membrane receptor protein involved in Fe transport